MKNKFILGLILGIFLIGLVSAGITGYLTRGQTAMDSSGISATLTDVSRSGIASISVQTPSGRETVQVAEGETATTSEGVEISAANLRTGSLFRRAGAEIELNPVPEVRPIDGSGGTGKIEQNTNI